MSALKAPFYLQLINRLTFYISHRKYECLLFSFILLIFTDTFIHQLGHFIAICNLLQNMLAGILIFYNRKALRNLIILLIIASVILNLFETYLNFIDVHSWQGIIYLIYFFLVAKEVYKEVLYAKTVTRELLAAALCGFVLLCLIGTFLFYQIDIKSPHAFSISGNKRDIITNLNYFSFTTLLTIGYGDITPLSLVAKRAVMLIGLAGHFYTVFITSIIIGKYLSVKHS
jgi:voltage-gated potassium channel